MFNPFRMLNKRGIAEVTTTSVTVNADNVVLSFPNHAFLNSWYRGIVLMNLLQSIPSGTTGTLPILLETNGVTIPLTTYSGAAVTVSDIAGTGIYQVYYDKQSNTLQLMTGAV